MASMVGGYIGVDVFFVLSGFLITGLLLTAGDGGAVGLITFYGRRARRLLPLALVVLVATAVAWLAIAGSVEREPLTGDIRSAALYFSNWHFAAQATDYFASADAPSPFVHFWSLSAEEQFYLVWPALIALAYLAARGSRKRAARLVAVLAAVLMAASLVSLVLTTRHGASSYAYFATNNRAYQLLGGAVLAVWAHRRRARRLRAGEPAIGASAGFAAEFAGSAHPTSAHPAGAQSAGGTANGVTANGHGAGADGGAGRHAATEVQAIAAGAHAAGVAGTGSVTAGAERARTGVPAWLLLGAVQVLAIAGLVYASSSRTGLGPGARGALSAAITLVLLAALELVPTAPGGWLLARPGWAYLGRISYGTYLWHWPVILLIRRFAVMAPWQLFIVAGVLSISLASLTHRLFEDPIRRSRSLARRPRTTIAAGVALSLVVALLVGPPLMSSSRRPVVVPAAEAGAAGTPGGATGGGATGGSGTPSRTLPPPRTHTPVPNAAALKDAGTVFGPHPYEQQIPDAGRTYLEHRGSGPTVLVIGDSHLEQLFQPLNELAVERDFTLYTWIYYVCPWEKGVFPVDTPGQPPQEQPCRNRKQEMHQKVLETIHPDIVIAVNRGYEDPNQPRPLKLDGRPDLAVDPGKVLAASAGAAAADILTYAKRLVVIEPWPSLKVNQRVCLSKVTYVEQCRDAAAVAPGKLPSEVAFRKLAQQDPRVATVDLDKVACPALPVCDAVRNGIVTYRDFDHLTVKYSEFLKPQLAAKLQAAGAFG
jgi:peptidoglycan/LPS O-acetylase OafA/YrhL